MPCPQGVNAYNKYTQLLSIEEIPIMKKIIVMSIGTLFIAFFISGCTTSQRQDVGIVGGAVVGGIAGNAISGGNAAGTIAGAAVGGVVGNELAK